MKKTRLLVEVGSSCCLLIPFISSAADAAQPSPLPDAQLSPKLPYPVVGIDPLAISQWEENNWQESESFLPQNLETLDLQISEEQYSTSLESDWPDLDFDEEREGGNNEEEQSASLVEHSSAGLEYAETAYSSLDSSIATESSMPLASDGFFASDERVLGSNETSQEIPQLSDVPLLGTLMVELYLGENRVPITTLVKGAENGQHAISFDQWLIPYDDVLKIFNLTASLQTDGRLALSSTDVAATISLESLPQDPELGVMWSVADIYQHLGASAEFDRESYAIRFNRESINQSTAEQTVGARSVASQYEAIEALLPKEHTAEESVSSVPTAATVQSAISPNSDEQIENLQLPEEATTDISTSVGTSVEVSDQPTIDLSVNSATDKSLGVLLVGLSIDGLTTVEATLVKGRENGLNAIAFDQWLVPFDDAIALSGATVTRQSDGRLYIRAPGVAKVIDPNSFTVDPDIGLALSITEIADILGLEAEFNFRQYAINFLPLPSNGSIARSPSQRTVAPPIVTAGLPLISPTGGFNLGGIRQTSSLSGSAERGVDSPAGQVTAIGSLGGGSWYTRLQQPDLTDSSTWQLSELQYTNQSDEIDYALGTQSTFWPTQSTRSDYWGATTIHRWGFTPPETNNTQSGFNPQRRLQSDKVERSVVGEAAPGTLVQLAEGITDRVIAETLVDSSGLYRFEDVLASGSLSQRYTGRGYVVKLYADGLLTNEPEIRSASLTTLPGQLPKGTSALISSIGLGRQTQNERFIGNFDNFAGGVAYRFGASESLSLGGGLILDENLHALVEAFYSPEDAPFQASISALMDLETGDPQVNADARYQPAENFALRFNSNQFSQQLSANWRVTPRLNLSMSGNTREQALSVGANTSYRLGNWAGSLSAAIDTLQQVRWSAYASNNDFRFAHRGNELSTSTSLTYRVPSSNTDVRQYRVGHELSLSYDTLERDRDSDLPNNSGALALMEWRYRAPQPQTNRPSPWTTSLGYGIGSEGSGLIASATADLGRGLELQARYQGVSAFDNEDSFRVSLVSRLGNRGGLGWGHNSQDRLRSQGGLLVQPFFDDNANGQLDADESLYLENPELLFTLDNKPMSAYQGDRQSDGLLLTANPGTYRMDIDAVGLPLDRTTAITSYAVDISPGQFTALPVPLVRSYAVSGVVFDANGVPVSGARVEAVSDDGHRRVSITNGAGVYYLERLKPKAYNLSVGGAAVEDSRLLLEDETESFQNREIRLRPETDQAAISTSALPYGLTLTM